MRQHIVLHVHLKNEAQLKDYKFFCFNGRVQLFKIDFDRYVNHRANYYSSNGELVEIGEVVCPPDYYREIHLPDSLSEMVALAENLAENVPFLRVDFYLCNKNCYFGELTFFPASGFGRFVDEKTDLNMGMLLNVSK